MPLQCKVNQGKANQGSLCIPYKKITKMLILIFTKIKAKNSELEMTHCQTVHLCSSVGLVPNGTPSHWE